MPRDALKKVSTAGLAALVLLLSFAGTARAIDLAAIVAQLVAAAKVAPSIPPEADTVMRTALAGLGRTSSWTESVVNTAGEDLWASANVPAELTNAVRSQIRYIVVKHSDETDQTVSACVRLGPDTNSPTLDCAAASQNGDPLLSLGAFTMFQVRSITDQATAANSVVPLWARGSTATAVNLTVTVGW